MSGYILSVDADFDLDDIWAYIAADNIDEADRWIEKLFPRLKHWDKLLDGTPARGPHLMPGSVLGGRCKPRDSLR